MNEREALKLALEAFELTARDYREQRHAITAIREALASSVATNDTSQERVDETAKNRHEQEPVAWRREYEGDVSDLCQWLYADEYDPKDDSPNWQPLYTTPPQRKPLPKGEWPKHPSGYVGDVYKGYDKSDLDNYAMQVLAAHGIKE